MTREFIVENLLTVKGVLNGKKLKQYNIKLDKEVLYNIYKPEETNICHCGKRKNFISFSKGYRQNCSYSCSSKNEVNKENKKQTCLDRYGTEYYSQNKDNILKISRKTKQTCLEKYGVESFLSLVESRDKRTKNISEKEIRQKIKNTKVSKGLETADKDKTLFEVYKQKVHNISNKEDWKLLANADKRSRADISDDAYHLDHKISIFYGFTNGISEEVIGGIDNLQMLPHQLNISKGNKCWSLLQ